MYGVGTHGNTGAHGGFVPQRRPRFAPPYRARCGACGALVKPGERCRCLAGQASRPIGRITTWIDDAEKMDEAELARRRAAAKRSKGNAYTPEQKRQSETESVRRGNENSAASRSAEAAGMSICAKCGEPFEQNKVGRKRRFCYGCNPYFGRKEAAD